MGSTIHLSTLLTCTDYSSNGIVCPCPNNIQSYNQVPGDINSNHLEVSLFSDQYKIAFIHIYTHVLDFKVESSRIYLKVEILIKTKFKLSLCIVLQSRQ